MGAALPLWHYCRPAHGHVHPVRGRCCGRGILHLCRRHYLSSLKMGACMAHYEGDHLWHILRNIDYRSCFLLWLLYELGAHSSGHHHRHAGLHPQSICDAGFNQCAAVGFGYVLRGWRCFDYPFALAGARCEAAGC